MLLLPKVVELNKEGKEAISVLIKYVTYIAIIAGTIITACFFSQIKLYFFYLVMRMFQ